MVNISSGTRCWEYRSKHYGSQPYYPSVHNPEENTVTLLKKKKKNCVVNAAKKMLSEKLYLRDYNNLGGSEKAVLNSDFETRCYQLFMSPRFIC